MSGKTTTIEVHPSSGNVFEDLKLPDADIALVKADITSMIGSIIAKRGLTKVQAAKILGVDQLKVSALLRGQLREFSIEQLFHFVNALGHDVEIAFKPKHRDSAQGEIRVLMKRL